MAKARAVAKPASERWALPASQARSRATRSRLLEAAERAFAEHGYEGARLADIAQDAGCSVGAVYFRFKDKDALFSAIAESFIEEARAGLQGLLGGADFDTPQQILRTFVAAAARNFRTHKGLFRAIVERGIDQPRAMRTVFAFRDELARALQTLLKREAARAATLEVRVMTQMIYGFLLAGVLNKQAPTQIDDARAVTELANACIAYLQLEERQR
jgi:AcrR family transcriptional regulator